VPADFLEVFSIAGDQCGPDVSGGKRDQGIEGQSSQLVLAIAFFSTNDGKDFCGFEPVAFKRCDDADLPGQLVDKSQLKVRSCAPAKFVKHHGRAWDLGMTPPDDVIQ